MQKIQVIILQEFAKGLEFYSTIFENVLIMGDFNFEVADAAMKSFCHFYKRRSLVVEPTCFKNPKNQSCVDLFFFNCHKQFVETKVVETGLSDF